MATFLDQMLLELGFDNAKFIKGAKETQQHIKETKEAVEKHGKGIEESMHRTADSIKEVAMRALEMYAVLVAADSVGSFIDKMTKADSATAKLSSSLNESVETISELEMASQRFGGSAGSMDAQLRKISDTFYDLSINGKALPIALSQLMAFSGKNIDFSHGSVKQMLDTAVAIQKMAKTGPEGEAKAGYLARQLGYTDAQIAMMIQYGSGLKKHLDSLKPLALTEEQVAAAERYEKAWTELQQQATNFAHTFWTAVSPAVSGAVEKLNAWFNKAENQKWFNERVEKFAHMIETTDWSPFLNGLGEIRKAAGEIVDLFFKLQTVADWLNHHFGLGPASPAFAKVTGLRHEGALERNRRGSWPTDAAHDNSLGGVDSAVGGFFKRMWDGIKAAPGWVGSSIIGSAHAEGYAPRSPFGSLDTNTFKVEGRDVSRGNPVPVWIANARPTDPNVPGGPGGSTGSGLGGGGSPRGGGGGGSGDAGGGGSGGSAGGSSGSFLDSLARIESGNSNIYSRTDRDTMGPGTRSQGYFQIETGTWRQFGRLAGIDLNKYPRAMLAPRDVQAQVARLIPLHRFGGRTQRLLRQQFGPLSGGDTIGHLANTHGSHPPSIPNTPNVPVGAGAATPGATHNQHTSSRTTTTHVGQVTINTHAKDAHGIARAIREAMQNDTFARSQESGLV